MTVLDDWESSSDSELAIRLAVVRSSHLTTYADPVRVREDANKESEVLEAAYFRRQAIELIQNGADALTEDGSSGRVAVVLTDDCLYCANEGVPLSADGLESILYSTISPKRGEEIGRFGVGFKSVLALSSRPMLLSRSISIGFDEARSRRELEEHFGLSYEETPVLRLAEQLDPKELAAADPVVAELMQWASTIVVLPLDRDRTDWVVDCLEEEALPSRFLIFSSQVTELNIENRRTGMARRITSAASAGGAVLSENDAEVGAWEIRERTVELSAEAKEDGGKRFSRPRVKLAWAIPKTGRITEAPREIWSFFPIPGVGSSLPGILNTGWKLSEDRGNLVEGTLNEELIDAAAALVIESIPSLAPVNRPGQALDFLPGAPRSKGGGANDAGWAGNRLRESVWELAEDAALVPDGLGDWRLGSELLTWPFESLGPARRDLRERWADAVVAPAQWVHSSVMTGDRSRIARLLGAEDAALDVWLVAVLDESDAETSSALALGLAENILQLDAESESIPRTTHGLADVDLVRTLAGTWAPLGGVRLDDEAPEDLRPVDGLGPAVRRLQKQLGIAHDFGVRTLLQLANDAVNGRSAAQFWDMVHRMSADEAMTVLGAFTGAGRIPVRTFSGDFRASDRVLLAGGVLTAEHDPALVVDEEFHSGDRRILVGLLGLVAAPGYEPAGFSTLARYGGHDHSGPYAEYYRDSDEKFRYSQPQYRRTPQSRYAILGPADIFGDDVAVTHSQLFDIASTTGRVSLTELLLEGGSWRQPWVASYGGTKPGRYERIGILSPAGWLIKTKGVITTTLGPVAVAQVVGTGLSAWQQYLPVCDRSTEFAEVFALPERLEDVSPECRSSAMLLAAEAADRGFDTAPVQFLNEAAAAGWDPPQWDALPALTSSASDAVRARSRGERVWLQPHEPLTWPDAWKVSHLDRTSAYPAGEQDEFELLEYFPAVVELLDPDVAMRFRVRECDEVMQDGQPVPFGRSDDVFFVRRSEEAFQRKAYLFDELLPGVDPEVRNRILREEVAVAFAELVSRARSAPDDAARLECLIGEQEIVGAAVECLGSPGPADSSAAAAVLLTVFGPSVLRTLKRHIPPQLGVPSHWAGGRQTLAFVRRLGFPDEFAGAPKGRLYDEEIVGGPSDWNDLHPFQVEIADGIQTVLKASGAGVVDLPTGAGKTRVVIEAIVDHASEGADGSLGTVLWIAERGELCEQAVSQWSQLWRAKGLADQPLRIVRYWDSRHGGGLVETNDRNVVVVASRQQLHARLNDPTLEWVRHCSVLVIDEAHHATASTYLEIKDWRLESSAPVAILGLSATPFRSDEERSAHLAKLFDRSLVSGEMMGASWPERIRWLQDAKYLSKIEIDPLDLGEVDVQPNEETLLLKSGNLTTGLDSLNERLGLDSGRNSAIADRVQEMDSSWPVVVFAGSVRHAQLLSAELSQRGISSRPIWGELAPWARTDAIEKFRSGEIRVLTNYGVLTEGFDAPKTRAVVVARFVQSDALFIQMLGRGMRGPKNRGTEHCTLVTTGESLPARFGRDGNLDVNRFDYLWSS